MSRRPHPLRPAAPLALAGLEAARLLFAGVMRRRMPARLYAALGGRSPGLFSRAGGRMRRRFHDGDIGATFEADLADWLEREHYFRGYPDRANLLLARRWLRPGDTWIDIGANRGVLALHAARLVGPAGRAFAFEPHPATFRLLMRHLELNPGLPVRPRQAALGAARRTVPAAPHHGHHGQFHLRREAPGGLAIPVERAEDLLAPEDLRGRTLVKIDVEGFEWDVLQGMGWILDRPQTSFSIEVSRDWLAERGTSVDELLAFMARHGFAPRRLGLRAAGRGGGVRLHLTAPDPREEQADLWFRRPGEG